MKRSCLILVIVLLLAGALVFYSAWRTGIFKDYTNGLLPADKEQIEVLALTQDHVYSLKGHEQEPRSYPFFVRSRVLAPILFDICAKSAAANPEGFDVRPLEDALLDDSAGSLVGRTEYPDLRRPLVLSPSAQTLMPVLFHYQARAAGDVLALAVRESMRAGSTPETLLELGADEIASNLFALDAKTVGLLRWRPGGNGVLLTTVGAEPGFPVHTHDAVLLPHLEAGSPERGLTVQGAATSRGMLLAIEGGEDHLVLAGEQVQRIPLQGGRLGRLSPQGKYIALTSHVSGDFAHSVYEIDLASLSLKKWYEVPGRLGCGAWSADGSLYATCFEALPKRTIVQVHSVAERTALFSREIPYDGLPRRLFLRTSPEEGSGL